MLQDFFANVMRSHTVWGWVVGGGGGVTEHTHRHTHTLTQRDTHTVEAAPLSPSSSPFTIGFS